MRYLIIGNGVAGTTAADRVRKVDGTGEITIVTEETLPFYSRIRLIDFIAGDVEEEGLVIRSPAWFEANRIYLIVKKRVVRVDPSARDVTLSTGERLPYDRLLIASGGVALHPPLQDSHRDGIFTLRTVSDARAVRDYAARVSTAIVLGGGVLGIEVANALRKAGKLVTVVECFPRLLPKQLDPDGAAFLRRTLEERGLHFFLDSRAKAVMGDGPVEGLLLEDGRRVEGDMIVLSTGIKPDLSLADGLGIRPGTTGIPVNDRMETALQDVYAAGDVAEHRGTCYGLWQAAETQGAVAGTNMAGGQAVYKGTLPSNLLKVAGVDLLSAGEIDAAGDLPSIVMRNGSKGIYKKMVISDGRLVGCILCGDLRDKGRILLAVKNHSPIRELADVIHNGLPV